ncbi:hypothetical protein HKX48_001006, partial [Thoreauomyces humboldtii]
SPLRYTRIFNLPNMTLSIPSTLKFLCALGYILGHVGRSTALPQLHARADSRLIWKPCPETFGSLAPSPDRNVLPFQCTTFQPPSAYVNATTDNTVTVAFKKLPARSGKSKGDVWFLNGNGDPWSLPILSVFTQDLWWNVNADRDVYLFVYRGVADSTWLQCGDDITMQLLEASTDATAVPPISECVASIKSQGLALSDFKTSNMVRDLQQAITLTQAGGKTRKITLYGISFGTFVAQRFIRMFPDTGESLPLSGRCIDLQKRCSHTYDRSVRNSKAESVVLDGVIQYPNPSFPRTEWMNSLYANNETLGNLMTRCDDSKTCKSLFTGLNNANATTSWNGIVNIIDETSNLTNPCTAVLNAAQQNINTILSSAFNAGPVPFGNQTVDSRVLGLAALARLHRCDVGRNDPGFLTTYLGSSSQLSRRSEIYTADASTTIPYHNTTAEPSIIESINTITEWYSSPLPSDSELASIVAAMTTYNPELVANTAVVRNWPTYPEDGTFDISPSVFKGRMLLFNGELDAGTALGQARKDLEFLKTAGVDAELMVDPSAWHASGGFSSCAAKSIAAFVEGGQESWWDWIASLWGGGVKKVDLEACKDHVVDFEELTGLMSA